MVQFSNYKGKSEGGATVPFIPGTSVSGQVRDVVLRSIESNAIEVEQ